MIEFLPTVLPGVEFMSEVQRLRLYHALVEVYKKQVPCSDWDEAHKQAAEVCHI